MEDVVTDFELKSTRLSRICACCGQAFDKVLGARSGLASNVLVPWLACATQPNQGPPRVYN